MKMHALVLGFAVISGSAYAGKDCEELKGEIDAKIKAKGVEAFSLNVVASDEAADGKVVGSCEGGTKKIIYTRGGSAPVAAATKTEEGK